MGFIADGARAEGLETESFRPCKVTQLFRREDLDDDDRAVLESRFSDATGENPASLHDWLAGLGVWISETTIRDHRKGRCCLGTGKVGDGRAR